MTDDVPFGARLKTARLRAGMTRPVLAGQVGKSAEWLKSVENGRLLPPRLPLLLQLAEVLGISNLADLTGDERLSTATFGKAAHEQLPEIERALASYPVVPSTDPIDVPGLVAQVKQAWELWHGTRNHRSAVATLIPGLLHDARVMVRRVDGAERRAVLAAQAQTYHLTQLYLSFQPKPELVTLTGDRAMTAAQDADNPQAMAAAAWYVNHVFRDAGQQHEARVQLAHDTASLLRPDRDRGDLVMYGLLHLAMALSHAKVGHDGDAWRHWDVADRAAMALPTGYSHPWLIFGRGMVDAYAITMLVDLMKPGDAARQADQLHLGSMASATRRAFHTIEMARAFHQNREPVAAVHLLRKAEQHSTETARFNLFTRAAVSDLAENGGATVRDDARELSQRLGLNLP
ncbi:multiprotein-bridging factor 1 family protein [Amycolatopsis thailandensis]|uniref:multiprotein-bridging factor 1 family protein n=1 Tax=Amycolatopsis thailandensis TaxID=589330 RepID=UPI0037A43094